MLLLGKLLVDAPSQGSREGPAFSFTLQGGPSEDQKAFLAVALLLVLEMAAGRVTQHQKWRWNEGHTQRVPVGPGAVTQGGGTVPGDVRKAGSDGLLAVLPPLSGSVLLVAL